MKCESIPFDRLPFSDLYRKYSSQSRSLSPFFEAHPFRDRDVKKRAAGFEFSGKRDDSAEALTTFNRSFDAPESTFRQIERLRDPESLAVVTGQQLILCGGPLFTVYKTMTTILFARRWEALLNRPVIPVFWLADEDHDFAEASEVGLFSDEHRIRMELEREYSDMPVGRVRLGEEYEKFRKDLFSRLPDSDFSEDLRDLLDRHYHSGQTFRQAFGGLLLELFGSQGLVLAGSEDPVIKPLVAQPMIRAAREPLELAESLEKQSRELESVGFGRQAMVQPSNLFYIDSSEGRKKLDFDNDRWSGVNGAVWTREELGDQIQRKPAHFSPNVFLRPLMQDRLLPTIAYVCGPGELAYYAQMKCLYRWAGQQMPLLLPRFSITLSEPAINRVYSELPFEFADYTRRTEDLETEYVKQTDTSGVEDHFREWGRELDRLQESVRRSITTVDATLEASAGRAGAVWRNELDRLRNKTFRAIKKREEIQIRRIHRVRENLFPDGKLQERQIAFVYFMNRYGVNLWDCMMDLLEKEWPDEHKLITL